MELIELSQSRKQTDIGLIPEDWEVRELGSLASIGAGGTPSRGNPSYWDGGIPWITTTQIDSNTIGNAEQFITALGLTNSAASLLPQGTLLMALYGQGKTRGKVSILGIDATTNQACAAIRVRSDISRQFVFHFLVSRYEATRGLSNSGSQDNLNGQIVKSIQIPLPPTLAEQEAIAEALSDADALIKSLEQLIAKKRQIKQGAMQELLTGKRRLPGFDGEWGAKRLGDIAEVSAGGTPSRTNPVYWDGDIPWVTTTEIDGRTIRRAGQQITKKGLTNSAARLYPSGTLLMALYGQGKTRGKVGILGIEAATNQACAAIEIRDDTSPNYVLLNLTSRYNEIREMSNTGNQENLNGQIVKSIVVPLPDPDEQSAITTLLTDMDAEIAALESKLDKYRQIKQGMMHNLLTGKIRLI